MSNLKRLTIYCNSHDANIIDHAKRKYGDAFNISGIVRKELMQKVESLEKINGDSADTKG